MRAILLTSFFFLAGAATATAQVQPDPGASLAAGSAPRFTGECLDSRDGSAGVPALDFEGWSFEPLGNPEPIQADNLTVVGALGGLPLFTGRMAEPPVVDLWVPVCRPADHYQLFTRFASPGGSAGP
ncbi:MAG TPA: hypothetical protein VJP59_08350 [Gemmatimonadota bacterium]|nr:hypothetical protein [Gemmatimonadota bacterium]